MRNPKQEKTVFIIKPDGVKRGLVGEIISRFEKRGLKIIALNMIWAAREEVDKHYPKDEAWIKRLGEKSLANYKQYGVDPKEKLGTDEPEKIGKMIREWVLDFMTSGPMVKGVVEGVHAVDMVRKICGNSLPNVADMGTIRGDFSVDSPVQANLNKRSLRNIIHASETPEEAANEIALWFSKKEIHDYKRAEEDIMF
ncbi:MAG: nucleoside-diphosphate kinase [Candidatus Pacebacteria bacterium]|nr:nucleoside-diphosphate kinase [Candidatus Paceibacterota bacterium]NUQ56982.1 nucleoside-diphosphate kinase [Candidatus Paceibacter sp.]